MYAIIRTGGKQYQVSPGDYLEIERLPGEIGEEITFNEVLLVKDDEDELHIGTPLVNDASVTAEILAHDRSKKVIVFKLKRRKGYRRKQGHRQEFVRIRIKEILLSKEGQEEPQQEESVAETG